MLFIQFHRVISSPPQKKNKKNYNGTYNLYYIFHLCPGSILLTNSLRNFIKKKIKNKGNWYQKCSKFRKNRKSKKHFLLLPVNTISQEQQAIQIWPNPRLRKRKGQEGLWEVRKFRKNRKSNKDFFFLAKNTEQQISKK